jgi:hypothetical protein
MTNISQIEADEIEAFEREKTNRMREWFWLVPEFRKTILRLRRYAIVIDGEQ